MSRNNTCRRGWVYKDVRETRKGGRVVRDGWGMVERGTRGAEKVESVELTQAIKEATLKRTAIGPHRCRIAPM